MLMCPGYMWGLLVILLLDKDNIDGHQKMKQIIANYIDVLTLMVEFQSGSLRFWKVLHVKKQTEAFIKEQLWYDHLEADLNTIRPYTTIEEYKDKFLEYRKQWYITNKETIASRKSENLYCESCDCYHNKSNKARHNRSSNHINNLAKLTDK